jgi:hypothetical protein
MNVFLASSPFYRTPYEGLPSMSLPVWTSPYVDPASTEIHSQHHHPTYSSVSASHTSPLSIARSLISCLRDSFTRSSEHANERFACSSIFQPIPLRINNSFEPRWTIHLHNHISVFVKDALVEDSQMRSHGLQHQETTSTTALDTKLA